MTEQLLAYTKHLNASQEVLSWLSTTGSKALKTSKASESELEHILDYLVSSAAPKRLQKLSITDAKRKTAEWTKANQKHGKGLKDGPEDIKVIHDFLDGTKIVQLCTKQALQREGFLMSHCVGSYSPETSTIYSYRDASNMPHATFEVAKHGGEIMQIKGKGNGSIHPKYIHPILAFLQAIGFNIRPTDMKNLGYYHIPENLIAHYSQLDGFDKQTVVIAGHIYAF